MWFCVFCGAFFLESKAKTFTFLLDFVWRKSNLKISNLIANAFSFHLGREEIGDHLVNYRNTQACIPVLLTWLSANMFICFAVLKTEPAMASPSPYAIVKISQEVQSGKHEDEQ